MCRVNLIFSHSGFEFAPGAIWQKKDYLKAITTTVDITATTTTTTPDTAYAYKLKFPQLIATKDVPSPSYKICFRAN